MSKAVELRETFIILDREVAREVAKEIWEELDKIFGKPEQSLPYYPPGVRDWEIPPVTCEPPYVSPAVTPGVPWTIIYSNETV